MESSEYTWEGTFIAVVEREGQFFVVKRSNDDRIFKKGSKAEAVAQAKRSDIRRALLRPRDAYEAATFHLLDQTRQATVFIAWIVGIWAALSLIGALLFSMV